VRLMELSAQIFIVILMAVATSLILNT